MSSDQKVVRIGGEVARALDAYRADPATPRLSRNAAAEHLLRQALAAAGYDPSARPATAPAGQTTIGDQ